MLLPLMAAAQTEVRKYLPGETTDGVTYFLPKTCLRVTVKATRVHYEPGEYAAYAERFLRLKDVTQQVYDEWRIDEVKLATYGKADKTRAYSIKVKQKTTAPYVTLATDGRLLSVNAPAQPEADLSEPLVAETEEETTNAGDFKTEEMLAAGSTMKMAELAANEIYDIRENRALLSKGQADFMPKDGEQLRIMMESLKRQEEGLLMLFKGTTRTQSQVFTFDYVPSNEVENDLLFRFSKFYGRVDNDDLSGYPVYVSVKDLHALPEAVAQDGKSKERSEQEDVRYIVPGKANITVSTDNGVLARQSFPMAQFGRIEYLGGELFNRKQMTAVTFSPETGAIVKITADESHQKP